MRWTNRPAARPSKVSTSGGHFGTKVLRRVPLGFEGSFCTRAPLAMRAPAHQGSNQDGQPSFASCECAHAGLRALFQKLSSSG
eukprot:2917490-Amphidinium_carterae.2